jgi:SNF2 family DNA or RNA helicase
MERVKCSYCGTIIPREEWDVDETCKKCGGHSVKKVKERELFQLHTWDDKTFILRAEKNMDASTYTFFHSRIMGLPERRYSRQLEAWMIPITDKNIEYFLNTFDLDEYSVDELSFDIFDYQAKTKQLQEIKSKRRWKYTFEGKVPKLKIESKKISKTNPYDHQITALDAVHGSEYFGLLMEMGTGKTKVIIDEINWSESQRVLIVCPKSVIGTWKRELQKHSKKPFFFRRLRSHDLGVEDLLDGLHAKEKIKVWITNYERIMANLDGLKRMGFDILVADESTYIKEIRTKRTKAMIELAETCKRRFIMTGTPAGNNLLDLFAQFEFLQPGILGYSTFNAFKKHYGRFALTRGGFDKLIGYKGMEELKMRMANCSFVVKKKDCLDLPEKIYEERYVEMGKVQRELYEQMLSIAIADIEGSMSPDHTVQATVVIVQLLRLSQICCGYLKTISQDTLAIPDGNVKIQALKETIEAIDAEEKICIWARFRWDITQICNLLRKMKISFACITGNESEKQRNMAVETFEQDWGPRVIVGEPGCGGMGVTLIGSPNRPCTNVIYAKACPV